MILSVLSYLVIPIYTLIFVGKSGWFSSNFSVIGSLSPQRNLFSAWAILLIVTLYPMLFPLIGRLPGSPGRFHAFPRRTVCFILLNAALFFLTAAVILPYNPSRFPLQARLHVFCALFAGVSLFSCLVILIHSCYRMQPARFSGSLAILWGSFAISMVLLFCCGIVNSALEILVTITACVLSRQMYRKVFGR